MHFPKTISLPPHPHLPTPQPPSPLRHQNKHRRESRRITRAVINYIPHSYILNLTTCPRSYATAKDEFEIASEETEKKTVYAADDRAAAQEELAKLKEAYEKAVREEGGEEVRRRVGHRLRELENAVKVMEERAMED